MWTEDTSVTKLEKRYMTERRQKIYIALEEMNFVWCWSEVEEFIQMWDDGTPFLEIAEHFGRDSDELALLLMDLARKGRVKSRRKEAQHG